MLDGDKIAGAVALPDVEGEKTLPFSAHADDEAAKRAGLQKELSARMDALLAEIRADLKTLQ